MWNCKWCCHSLSHCSPDSFDSFCSVFKHHLWSCNLSWGWGGWGSNLYCGGRGCEDIAKSAQTNNLFHKNKSSIQKLTFSGFSLHSLNVIQHIFFKDSAISTSSWDVTQFNLENKIFCENFNSGLEKHVLTSLTTQLILKTSWGKVCWKEVDKTF